MRTIRTREELVALARELGMRSDWHEPDEQDVTAVVEGTHMDFDNAMPPGHWFGEPGEKRAELHVILHRTVWEDGQWRLGRAIAVVNLAMLFAWATGHESDVDADTELGERVAQAILAQCESSHLDFGAGPPADCEHQRYAALVRDVVSSHAPSTSDAADAVGVAMLRKWQAKMTKQANDAAGPMDRAVAHAIADAFGVAARIEQALYDSRKRHPSASVLDALSQ